MGLAVDFEQPVEDWQRKGTGLAGAGLGNAQDVAAFQKVWYGLGLDWRWRSVFARQQGALDRIGEAELREILNGH